MERLSTFLPMAAIGFFVLFAGNASGDLIYTLENYAAFQNGHTLSGTITTTDAAPDDGLLMNAEIIDWSFSVSGPTSFMASKNPASFPVVTGDVGISPTQITLGFPPGDMGVNEFFLDFETVTGPSVRYLRINDIFGAGIIDDYSAFPSIGRQAWQEVSGAPLGGDPWVIAVAVPEPSMVGLWSLACLAVIGRVITRRYVS